MCARRGTGRSSPIWCRPPPTRRRGACAGAGAGPSSPIPTPRVEAGFAYRPGARLAELRRGRRTYQGAQQNMAFADRQGSHRHDQPGPGARSAAAVTAGSRCLAGPVPMTGSGRSPPKRCHASCEPAAGLLVNANNRLVGDDYPHLLTRDWDPALRARPDRSSCWAPATIWMRIGSRRSSSTSPRRWRWSSCPTC